MKSLWTLLLFVPYSVAAQDTLVGLWNNELELSTYTVNIRYYGGQELNYEFGRRFGKQKQSEIGVKAGIFYARFRKDKQYSYIPAYLYYRLHFRSHRGSLHFNAGVPVFWLQDDSKILSGTFWSTDEEEEFGYYRKQIALINQLEYEYYFKFRLGISLGVTNYLTQVSGTKNSPAFDNGSYGINPGFKLGISYRF